MEVRLGLIRRSFSVGLNISGIFSLGKGGAEPD